MGARVRRGGLWGTEHRVGKREGARQVGGGGWERETQRKGGRGERLRRGGRGRGQTAGREA